MVWFPNRRDFIKAGAAATFGGLGLRAGLAQDIPDKPEAGAIKMGIEPWLGYGQWHIAAKKDLFKAQGLESVEVINFNTDADINAALAAGQLQCGNIATHTAMNFIAAGLPIKIVALLDVSKTADAMISDGSVTDIKGLKGKQVAYEEGTTSDILLNYALSQNGMTIADIEKVPMPASDAGSALIAGKVPVAVTYEPYLTLAMQQNPKVKMIYSAGENPGLISDVFVVRDEFLERQAGPDRRSAQGLGCGARRLPQRHGGRAGHHLRGRGRQARGARHRLRRRRLLFARREQDRDGQFHRQGHTGSPQGGAHRPAFCRRMSTLGSAIDFRFVDAATK